MRDDYWQQVRGVAIIAVVMIHATSAAQNIAGSSENILEIIILRQFINFAVPLFLCISGYFATNYKNRSILKYYFDRSSRIIYPYIFWTILYIFTFHFDKIHNIKFIILMIATGSGIFIGYFIIVLLQMILITPIIYSLKRNKHIITLIIFTFIGLFYTYYINIEQQNSWISRFPYNGLPFFVWYPFYHLGVYIKSCEDENRTVNLKPKALLISWVAAVGLSITEAVILMKYGISSMSFSQVKFSSFLASTFLFLYFVAFYQQNKPKIKFKFVSYLGNISFFVYFFHLIPLILLERIFKEIHINIYSYIMIIVLSVLTLGSCCIAANLGGYLPNTIKKRLLGL